MRCARPACSVELASCGRAKFNSTRLAIPKTHALDAVCVGALDTVSDWCKPTLVVRRAGRSSYRRRRLDRFGFPRGS